MRKINSYKFILALIVSIALVAAVAGSTELKSDDITRTSYWAPQSPPRAHYKIDCSIDPAKGLLEGREVICFKNTTSKPIHRLAITWLSDNGRMLKITSKGEPVSILAETK